MTDQGKMAFQSWRGSQYGNIGIVVLVQRCMIPVNNMHLKMGPSKRGQHANAEIDKNFLVPPLDRLV